MANVPYTAEEYYNMFACLTRTGRNPNEEEEEGPEGPDPRRAAVLYRETYEDDPNVHRYPDFRVFQNLHRRLMHGGPLVPGQRMPRARQGRRAGEVPEELQLLIMNQFLANPNLSTRVCALRLGLEKDQNNIVHRVLKAHGFHPYRYKKVQALLPRDFANRANFCQNMNNRFHADPGLVDRILWSDECTFTVNGMFNNKNFVYWTDENPFNVRATKHQYRWSLNIWCGIVGDGLVNSDRCFTRDFKLLLKQIECIFCCRLDLLYCQNDLMGRIIWSF